MVGEAAAGRVRWRGHPPAIGAATIWPHSQRLNTRRRVVARTVVWATPAECCPLPLDWGATASSRGIGTAERRRATTLTGRGPTSVTACTAVSTTTRSTGFGLTLQATASRSALCPTCRRCRPPPQPSPRSPPLPTRTIASHCHHPRRRPPTASKTPMPSGAYRRLQRATLMIRQGCRPRPPPGAPIAPPRGLKIPIRPATRHIKVAAEFESRRWNRKFSGGSCALNGNWSVGAIIPQHTPVAQSFLNSHNLNWESCNKTKAHQDKPPSSTTDRQTDSVNWRPRSLTNQPLPAPDHRGRTVG